ncbi:hypothetical protein CZ794_05900 [Psychrobacter sp. JB385]|nr:hypothetical protein CZ794_05900 [Psychrobacter sp. JB385]
MAYSYKMSKPRDNDKMSIVDALQRRCHPTSMNFTQPLSA